MTAEAVMNEIPKGKAADAAGLEEIMRTTERRVAQVAWAILGNVEDVKDAMQDTYLRAFRHLRRYDTSRDLTAWVVAIAVNVCRDVLKKRRPTLELVDTAQHSRIHDNLMLRRAIDSLPEKERMAVILHDVEGMTSEEVAAAIGNTAATVRVQLSRARAKLRQLLGGRS